MRDTIKTVEGDPFNPREIRNSAERIRVLAHYQLRNGDIDLSKRTLKDAIVLARRQGARLFELRAYCDLRRHKGLTEDEAARTLDDPLFFGAMLVAPLMTPLLANSAAIVEGWGERAVAAWKLVHLEGLLNGMLLMIVGATYWMIYLRGRKDA